MHFVFDTFVCLFSGFFSEPTTHVLIHYNANYPSFVATENFVTFINNLWTVISLKSSSKGKNLYFVQKIHYTS